MTDHYGDGHREGDESDALNNARRKKVLFQWTLVDNRNGGAKIPILMHFQAETSGKRSEKRTFLPSCGILLMRRDRRMKLDSLECIDRH